MKKLLSKFNEFLGNRTIFIVIFTALVIVMLHSILINAITKDWESVVDNGLILVWMALFMSTERQLRAAWRLIDKSVVVMDQQHEVTELQDKKIKAQEEEITNLKQNNVPIQKEEKK